MAYKRILTIQDISCVGQCSITVAMPILSACGHETCILPTAMLSTHTGGFGMPAVRQLADTLPEIWRHWQREGITFDAIYTGYLGSTEAIRCAGEIMDNLLAPDGKTIVDPAMADNGKLYAGLDEGYAQEMKRLCEKADVMIPNITEAAMMTGLPYNENYDEGYITKLMDTLGGKTVVLTGVGYTPGETGAVLRTGEGMACYQHARIGKNYHGTGDIFASCFVGAWMQERELYDAVKIASDFTCRCIDNTHRSPAHWYGVKFETALPELMRILELDK